MNEVQNEPKVIRQVGFNSCLQGRVTIGQGNFLLDMIALPRLDLLAQTSQSRIFTI